MAPATAKIKTRLSPADIETYVQKGYWINKPLAEYLDEAVAHCPDKEAVVDRDRRLTYRQVGQMVNRLALGFLEMGIQQGDVVSFQLPNWLEALVIHHAVSKIGAITNPIMPIYRSKEVKYILELAASKVLIIPHRFRKLNYVEMYDGIVNELPELKKVLVIGGQDLEPRFTDFDTFINTPWEKRRDLADLKAIQLDPNDVTLLMFTSGTESEPKGVLHTYNTLNRECWAAAEARQYDSEEVFFNPSPVTHIGGLLYALELPVMLKAKVVLMDIWDPDEAIRIIERERGTNVGGATPFMMGILRSPILKDHDLSSLKMFSSGGAGVPPEMIREFARLFPGCSTGRGYGSTEYPTISTNYANQPLDKAAETDGRPADGTEVKIVDDDGQPVPVGTSGTILVRGPECFVGYLNPELNTKYFDEQGWFRTGDIGKIDDTGHITVTGREKDIIIRGGENLSAKEIEDVLYTHPDISEVAVVGMPDPIMQERACAYIKLKPGRNLTLESMIDFLADKDLAKQKYPERLEIVDEFPMTQSGKVQKFMLRKDIKDKLEKETVQKS